MAAAYLTNFEPRRESDVEKEKAWHLLSVLLSIGRPARPVELASRCSLFQATQEFVEFLCSIPDSPLFLRGDLFVTISWSAVSAMGEFVSKTIVDFVPRSMIEGAGTSRSWSEVRTYCRKRKGEKDDPVVVRNVKRRLFYLPGSGAENPILGPFGNRICHSSIKAHADIAKVLIRNMDFLTSNISIVPDTRILSREMSSIPLLLESMDCIPSKELAKIEHSKENKEAEASKLVHRELPQLMHKDYRHSFLGSMIDLNFPSVLECDGESTVPLKGMESSLFHKEAQMDSIYFTNTACSKATSCPEAEMQFASPVKTGVCESTVTLNDMESSPQRKETQMDNAQFTNKVGSVATNCPEAEAQFSSLPVKSGLPEPTVPLNNMESSLFHKEKLMDSTYFTSKNCSTNCPKAEIQFPSAVKTGVNGDLCEVGQNIIGRARAELGLEEGPNIASSSIPCGCPKDLFSVDNTAQIQVARNDLGPVNAISFGDTMTSLDKVLRTAKVECQPVLPSIEPSILRKQPTKSSAKTRSMHRNSSTPGQHVPSKLEDHKKVVPHKQQENGKQDQKCVSMKEKLKQAGKMIAKESKPDSTSNPPKKQLETKSLPDFESFIIEEEEGSGGYGTVYRARRKNDGKTFAIKCPHPNAHTHHIYNELKMLERFGGRNFVIKYEGSFKSGNSECFVLEHVEHDRPEVLKREIDIFELQWYGYCMFRALASLHKQGIVHRDVKPGNFLFSRKLSKGYLIDFNLAMDLHQKYGASSKSKIRSTGFHHVPLPTMTSPISKGRKVVSSRFLDAASRETMKNSKLSLEPKNMKKRADSTHVKAFPELGSGNIFKSQGADGSGITSTKDMTSTKTPSAERLRERVFYYKGRKELINLITEGADHKAVSVPASQSKRIAAPPGKGDRKHIQLTPMPLHSSGIAVSGAGMLINKGDGKHKREGPCVGTKGFRAPEVLVKSPHQGSKVDVWSAGVTLLYLIIGRTPFVGDPEQNIKDIAKLRGSEDLWEVAKLHNRESSFPEELYDIQSLPSVELEKWCKLNTKRPEFLEFIPESLYDLVDRCLTVNPRRRITAEEALRHDFFSRCHESLRRQRRLREEQNLDSKSAHPIDGQL